MADEVVFYHKPRSRPQMAHGMLNTAPGQGDDLQGSGFSAGDARAVRLNARPALQRLEGAAC